MPFGVMKHLNVILCADSAEAEARGYHSQPSGKYDGACPVRIDEVVIVQKGTEGGNSTADLLLRDPAGNLYVVMVTGNLLRSLPL